MASTELRRPFRIDAEYDREHASDGTSRYAAYVRGAVFEPWDDDQTVELAAFAWRRATTPVMLPGYVRYHPRVRTAQLERSDWDGSLLAMVDLVILQPASLRISGSDCDGRHYWWRDWPSEIAFSGDTTWYQPGGDDLAASPHLLCTASLRFTVPSSQLPAPPSAPALLTGACREAVVVLVAELNKIVGPVLDRIEGDR
jgi:hypothetical protein